MNLDPNIPLRHPELLHRALEGELQDTELEGWSRLRQQPEVADAAAELEQVTQSLRLLERIHAPPGFSSTLGKRIKADTSTPHLAAEIAVAGLPRLHAPDGFAGRLATVIAAEATIEPLSPDVIASSAPLRSLRRLERMHAPPGFASMLASQIAAEAGHAPVVGSFVRDAERGPTPLYFLGATLMGALLGALTLGWGEARTLAFAALAALQALPPSLIVTAAVAVLVALVTSNGRLRLGSTASLATFAAFAALSVPQIMPFVGSATVAEATGTVLRFGDLSVTGSIPGDVISIGGTLRLEPGARVSGRAVSVLGDLSVQLEAQAAGGLSAVAGVIRAGDVPTVVLKQNWPGLSAANALKPLRQFLAGSDWRILYFVLVAAVAVMLAMLSDRLVGLQRGFRAEAGRALGLGTVLTVTGLGFGLGFGLSGMLTTLGLLISCVVGVVFTFGFALSLLEFGHVLVRAVRRYLPRTLTARGSSTLEVSLALFLFALTLFWAPLAATVWVLGGAWGLGALALEWRSGRLAQELIQQVAH